MGHMVEVDSKGSIVLPQDVRQRLGITAGSEVDIRADDGNAIVEPAADPDLVIERMEALLVESGSEEGETGPLDETPDHIAGEHREAVRRGADCDHNE